MSGKTPLKSFQCLENIKQGREQRVPNKAIEAIGNRWRGFLSLMADVRSKEVNMTDITFNCPHCAQSLEAPKDMAGSSISCPACHKQITVPNPPSPTSPPRAKHPIKAPLPRSRSLPQSFSANTRPRSQKKLIPLCLVICLAYLAWPYLTLWRFYSAIRAAKTETISDYIDFPSLRTSLKDQMNAFLLKEMVEDEEMTDNPFTGLAAAFLPKMVDSMVDAYVTPAGVAQLFESKSFKTAKSTSESNTSQATEKHPLKDVKYAFFAHPTKFLLKTEDVVFVFRLRDWTWKLAEAQLTGSAIGDMRSIKGSAPIQQTETASAPADQPVTPSLPEPTTLTEPKTWQLRTDTSPIDDTTTYYLRREATEPIGSGFMRSTPTLLIRYEEQSLEVFISFDKFLGSQGGDVTVRIGQSPARQEKWGLSTDSKAIFCPGDNRAFVKELLEADRLVVRLTPYGESPITATFDLTGLTEAIEPMRNFIR